MIAKFSCLVGALAVSAMGLAQLTPAEIKGLDDALFIGNLTRKDLAFERNFRPDPFRLRFNEECLSNPLEGAEKLMKWHSGASENLPEALRLALGAFPRSTARSNVTDEIGDATPPPEIPIEYHEMIRTLAKAVSKASVAVRKGLEKLTMEERRDLIESLPRILTGDPNLKLDFVRREPISQSQAFALLAKVDLEAIRTAAVDLADTMDDQISKLHRISKSTPFVGSVKFMLGKLTCVFAGTGRDEHEDRDAALTIDLGGDDVYRGRYGAGVGYASALIDLGGNDTYAGPDLSFGAGILGVGLAIDNGGDDVIRGSSIGFGAGIAGVGAFLNSGGQDVCIAESMSLGYGAFGAGMYVDGSGGIGVMESSADQYTSSTWSQGAASVQGVGWLADFRGDDTYRIIRSNGSENCFGQGYASGLKGDAAGGIGLLTDLGGHDFYLGAKACQAAGAEFGIGSIYDRNGIDSYVALSQAQANGASGGGGFLFDLSGRDTYTLANGDGQCAGFDFGFALLLDRDGDDLYASRSARPGSALNYALAIFIDSDGEDRYGSAPLIFSGRIGNALAIFADFNGPDIYANDLEDGSAVSNSNGVAIDFDTHGTSSVTPIAKPSRPKAGSNSAKPSTVLSELYKRACGTGDDSEKAIDELVGIGKPALEWMIANRLATMDHRGLPVFVEVADAIGADGRNLIAFKVGDKNDAIALNALRICYEGDYKEASAMIVQALGREPMRVLAARAAGRFGAMAAVPELMALCADKDVNLVLAALQSLAELKETSSAGTAQAMLESPNPLIRRAAIRALIQFPTSAIASGKLFMRDSEERKARIGCELLSALGSNEALKELGAGLDDPRSGVRLQAAIGLAGRCPLDKRTSFMAVKRDPNPLVRMATAFLDPGR